MLPPSSASKFQRDQRYFFRFWQWGHILNILSIKRSPIFRNDNLLQFTLLGALNHCSSSIPTQNCGFHAVKAPNICSSTTSKVAIASLNKLANSSSPMKRDSFRTCTTSHHPKPYWVCYNLRVSTDSLQLCDWRVSQKSPHSLLSRRATRYDFTSMEAWHKDHQKVYRELQMTRCCSHRSSLGSLKLYLEQELYCLITACYFFSPTIEAAAGSTQQHDEPRFELIHENEKVFRCIYAVFSCQFKMYYIRTGHHHFTKA